MNEQEMKDLKNNAQAPNSSTIMAIIFIVVGAGLIFANVTGFSFTNWWVLFMLIPLSAFVRNIYMDYQANGRLTSASTGAIIASMAIILVAATFVFEAITWSMIWPVGLIFAGISIYLSNRS
ncbi:MAG: hypothetical protein KC445_08305 [Anaerolineales bacterium]|nr:hypothetical protein [Anaerolineales bacterium]